MPFPGFSDLLPTHFAFNIQIAAKRNKRRRSGLSQRTDVTEGFGSRDVYLDSFLTGSGMCDGGRILENLKSSLVDNVKQSMYTEIHA